MALPRHRNKKKEAIPMPFEHTQASYVFEINPFLNAATNDVGACVNPPDASYNTWPPPAPTAGKNPKLMSRQIV